MDVGSALRGLVKRASLILRQLGTGRIIVMLLTLGCAVLLARFSWELLFARDAEAVLYDLRAAAAAPRVEPDPRIVLVVYDDDTLILTGKRSPLDRTVLAKALARIDTMGAKSIGIDVLIDQPQPEDPVLVAAFKTMKTPTWLAYASNATNGDKITYEQQHFLEGFTASLKPGNVRPTSIRLAADSDNVLRRWPEPKAGLPPLLPFAAADRAPDDGKLEGSVGWQRAGATDREVFSSIPIQTLANDDLFASPEASALFRAQIAGRHVLIGGHIQDIDLFSTPVGRATGKQMWGLDVFAQMLAQLLDGRSYARIPAWVLWLAAAIAVTSGALTALGSLRPSVLLALFGSQLALIGALPFVLHARMIETYGLPVFGWGAGWIMAFIAVGSAARVIGSEQRRFAQSALGKYLPRDIAAQILRDPEGLSLKGEKRELFIVFSDLEGFTKLSHAIDPGVVASLLNRYLETLSEVVLSHGGTIDKFVGDAVVAFWGAPIARPDDGVRAVKAAIAMHAAGEVFRKTVPDGVPAIGRTRVGLHFGEVIVGNFGGEGRIQYTALGDAMNTASRLENANKQLGTSVLISRDAAERSGLTGFRALGTIELRGRATPVDIVEPSDADPETLATLADSVERARRGDEAALLELRNFSELHPNDAAMRNLVYRLGMRTEGGYFVLD
jgi:adenylate cyclase